MCGRFSILVDYEYARQQYLANVAFKFQPSYNVSPGQDIPVVVQEPGQPKPEIRAMKWGFIPSWTKDPAIGSRMINSRSETVHEKPMFKGSFMEKRCLILSSGFYEWKKGPEGKDPYLFRIKDKPLFSFAGIWSSWTDPEKKEVQSCSILTTSPNSTVRSVYDRMPVILSGTTEKIWLHNESSESELRRAFNPFPGSEMESFPVSKRVNSPANNDPELVKPLKRPGLGKFL